MSRRRWVSVPARSSRWPPGCSPPHRSPLGDAVARRTRRATRPHSAATRLLARANPIQFTYDSPGLLPVSPIIQVSAPESISTLNTGPAGFAWPASRSPVALLADLGLALKQTRPRRASRRSTFRCTRCAPKRSSRRARPHTDVSPAPGTRMHAGATAPRRSAFGAYDDIDFPGIFSVGSVTGTSSTSWRRAPPRSPRRKSVVSGFSLLAGRGGDRLDRHRRHRHQQGRHRDHRGHDRVSGATVGGQKATIDENGVSLAGKPTGPLALLLKQTDHRA